MAYIRLIARPRGVLRRYVWRYSRRAFGSVVEPVRAAAHHGGVLVAAGAIEVAAGRGWRKVDAQLRHLVIHSVSAAVGCSWCIDYGYYEGVQRGVDPAKLQQVPRWRESAAFDGRERTALEFAEAVTLTPAHVPGELAERLHQYFNDAELVELGPGSHWRTIARGSTLRSGCAARASATGASCGR